MVIPYPCCICDKCVRDNQKALLCTHCNNWVHIKCAGISVSTYNDINQTFVGWQCTKCLFSQLPFLNEYASNTEDSLNVSEKKTSNCNDQKGNACIDQFPKEKGMKIAHLNIRSLRNKIDDLNLFLSTCPYDLMSFSETWLDDSITCNIVSLNGYNLERKDRDINGGGVCCYIRENIPYIRRYDLEKEELELIWVELKPRNQTSLFVCIMYRQPSSLSSYFDLLEENLDCVHTMSDRIKRLTELSSLMGLSQLIQQPTRVTPNSSTLIDLVFVSKSMGEFQSGVQSVGLSDHSLVYVVTKLKSPKLNPKISTFRSFRFFEEEAFLSDLAAIDWDKTWSQLDNVNQKLDKFLSVYLKLCNKHAPYVTVRRKQKGSPWINGEYITIARERDYDKNKIDKCKENTYFETYKYYRNKANNLNKKLKRAYYRKDSSVDTRKKWRVLKELLPTKKSNNNSHILRNGEPVNDSYDIATEFNEMFSNIGVVNQNNTDKNRQKANCLSHFQLARSIFCFDEINADFIQNELSNLDCTKSMGLDDLHPRILKISARYIAIPLAHIFNESLCTGIFPQSFKLAKIVPIPKNKLTKSQEIQKANCLVLI